LFVVRFGISSEYRSTYHAWFACIVCCAFRYLIRVPSNKACLVRMYRLLCVSVSRKSTEQQSIPPTTRSSETVAAKLALSMPTGFPFLLCVSKRVSIFEQ